MNLWSADEIKDATGGQCSAIFAAKRIHTDSRTIMPGDLFVPLMGENFDGHQFTQQAFEKGAVAALVSIESQSKTIGDYPIVVVKDTFKALQDLAAYNRARCRGQFIGITGSVGKTSTKEMLKLALGTAGEVYATQGNYNNHIGVPLMLANMPRHLPFGVFEMGMNHAGEINPLAKLVRPSLALITGVEAVHLEFFDSVAAIADAKAEIMDGLEKNGSVVLNRDNIYYDTLLRQAQKRGISKITSFGEHPEATARLLSYKVNAAGMEIEANVGGHPLRYPLGAVGKHWATTSLAVLAAVHALGANLPIASGALASFSEGEGRGKLFKVARSDGAYTLIDDAYNASPASMRAAFSRMREIADNRGPGVRTVAVLGDMLELGEGSPLLHSSLTEVLEQNHINQVFTCGKNMKYLHDALPAGRRACHAADSAALLPFVKTALLPGDLVLIKGSNGSRMKVIRDALLQESIQGDR